jgi:hypothetical protein
MLFYTLIFLHNQEILFVMECSHSLRKELQSELFWEQMWKITYGRVWCSTFMETVRKGRKIYWDPFQNFGAPQCGWFHFFLLYEVCWLDWLLAGYNTTEKCLVGIDDLIYDVSAFIVHHPGSEETLTEGAGGDATEIFYVIGHSSTAIKYYKLNY